MTPNASRLRPVVSCCVARPASGPPVSESASSWSVRPWTDGKSDAAGSAAAPTCSRRPPCSGTLRMPSPPSSLPPPQPASRMAAAATAIMDTRRRTRMSLEPEDQHRHHQHHHHHGIAPDADRRRLAAALGLIAGFMVAEVVAGILAESLALLSDAAHMLTDAGALALALVAARLAARPPSGRFTFGLGRAEVLSAQLNGGALLVLGGVLAFEAVRRISSPPDVDAAIVVVIGLLGAAVNVLVAWLLARAERRSLNIEGARAHVVTDLYASLGAALAGAVILLTGFEQADAIAALLVSALMLRSGWSLVRDASAVLLEGSPTGVSTEEVGRTIASAPGIVEVHDLHVWEVTAGFPALAAHVLVSPGDDCHGRRREVEQLLEERFGIRHTTIQVDHDAGEALLDIEDRR